MPSTPGRRVCRGSDGEYFLVSETSGSTSESDFHDVGSCPCDEAGKKLAGKVASLSNVTRRCISDDAIIAAIVAL